MAGEREGQRIQLSARWVRSPSKRSGRAVEGRPAGSYLQTTGTLKILLRSRDQEVNQTTDLSGPQLELDKLFTTLCQAARIKVLAASVSVCVRVCVYRPACACVRILCMCASVFV